VFDSGHGLSTEEQEYNPTPIINEIRRYVAFAPSSALYSTEWLTRRTVNQAESYFSRLRRAEIGQHHRISGHLRRLAQPAQSRSMAGNPRDRPAPHDALRCQ
jgi:hypothetical protein